MLSLLSLLKKYRELLLSVSLLLLPFGLFIARGHKAREPNFLDRAVIAVASPLQTAMSRVVDGGVALWRGYVGLLGVQRQNAELLRENARLSGELNQLSEIRAENGRLRKLLNFSESFLSQPVLARVVGVSPDPNYASVRINRGENEGIARGMSVVTPEGVVGQIHRVTGWYADVLLLSDPRSKVAVRIQRTRSRALAAVSPEDRTLRLEYASRNDSLEEGDAVVTSGTDGIFPPGLLVGRLRNIVRQGTGPFVGAEIVPAVDPSRLEEVFVLPQNTIVLWSPFSPDTSAQRQGQGAPSP